MMTRFERTIHQQGYQFVAGVDEAGRGPLAGPVVAAAVILPTGYTNPFIKDSKQLSAQQRQTLYQIIREDARSIGLGVIEASVIDTINILQATRMAMKEAVLGLSRLPEYLLVDGKHTVPVEIPQSTIVRGDAQSVSIAAASIIAKVSRDMIMEMYHRQFPHYNFQQNKGYGTAEHREAIKKHGTCRIHRKSFRHKTPPNSCPKSETLFD